MEAILVYRNFYAIREFKQSYSERENKFYDRKQRNKKMTVYDRGIENQGGEVENRN